MAYWDTSALLKIFVKESDPDLFRGHLTHLPVTSALTFFELRTAFYRKESEGAIQTGEAEQFCQGIEQRSIDGLIVTVDLGVMVMACFERVINTCFSQIPVLPIRTLDAIHIASALAAGEMEFVTADIRQRDSAKLMGLSVFS